MIYSVKGNLLEPLMGAALISWDNYLVSDLPFLKEESNVRLPQWATITTLKFREDITKTTSDIQFLTDWKQNHGVIRVPGNKTRPDRYSIQFSGNTLTLDSVRFVTMALKWYTSTLSGEKSYIIASSDPRGFFAQHSNKTSSDRSSWESSMLYNKGAFNGALRIHIELDPSYRPERSILVNGNDILIFFGLDNLQTFLRQLPEAAVKRFFDVINYVCK